MTQPFDQEPRRTDPRSFAVRAIALLSQLVLPILIGGYAILDKGELGDLLVYFLPLVVAAVGGNILIAYLRWSRLTYTVGDSDIRVESGVLSRAARSVPYERIQDVSLEQKPVPRLFGLVEVKFETGAGGGEDIALAYLPESEGERLRELVRARRENAPLALAPREPGAGEPDAETLYAMAPGRVLTFGLFEFSLAVVAVAAGLAQQLDFLLPFEVWDWRAWREQLAGPGDWLAGLGFLAQIIGGVIAVSSLLLVGLVTGVVRTVLREWGFRLERSDKGLRRRRGLLTRTDLVMPIHRVQALHLGTGIVRRLFGWHSLKLVSLASDSGSANHEAVPFAKMHEIAPVVAETGFALPPAEITFHRSSGKAWFDEAAINVVLLGAVAVVVAALSPVRWAAGVPLFFALVAAIRAAFLWRFNAHALDEAQIYSRHGWLAPRLAIGSRVKLQSVEIVRNPLGRFRGYADLHLGLAGGQFRIKRIATGEAQTIRAALLESMALQDFSEITEQDARGASGA